MLFLLLFAVPALSTLAKNSWYLPPSDPGHYLNIASKMQVRNCAVLPGKHILRIVTTFVPVPVVTFRLPEFEFTLPTPAIGVTVSVQHRSPPSSLV